MLSWRCGLVYQGIYLVTLFKTIPLEQQSHPDVVPIPHPVQGHAIHLPSYVNPHCGERGVNEVEIATQLPSPCLRILCPDHHLAAASLGQRFRVSSPADTAAHCPLWDRPAEGCWLWGSGISLQVWVEPRREKPASLKTFLEEKDLPGEGSEVLLCISSPLRHTKQHWPVRAATPLFFPHLPLWFSDFLLL